MNKRGLSPVIAVLMLIVVTIIAGVMIAGFVIPFVKNNLSKSTECLDYRDYFQFQEKFEVSGDNYRYNCYETSGNYHGASVKAVSSTEKNISSEISGIALVFSSGANSKKVEVKNGEVQSEIWRLGKSGEINKMPNPGETITYVFDAGEIFNKIEVYPILKSGRICDLTDSIDINICASNVDLT